MTNPLTTKCEICEKSFSSKLQSFHKFTSLCASCLANEILELAKMPRPNEVIAIQEKVITKEQFEYRITNDIATGFTAKEQFWNAEKTAISLIQGTVFERHQKVNLRLEQWQSILFEANQAISADYTALQEIRANLTNEEKTALKVKFSDYNPGQLNSSNIKPTIAKKPRESAEDKTNRVIAEGLFRAEILLGHSIEVELHAQHPDYYNSQGVIKPEYRNLLTKLFTDKGAITLDDAIQKAKTIMRTTKQKGFDSLGKSGNS